VLSSVLLEVKVSKAASKLVGQLLVCELKQAAGRFPTTDGEAACERVAVDKFEVTRTDGCDGCTDLTDVESAELVLLDDVNSSVYCAE
jgi:hypothetical protein